jgi:Recombination endonuclease VII
MAERLAEGTEIRRRADPRLPFLRPPRDELSGATSAAKTPRKEGVSESKVGGLLPDPPRSRGDWHRQMFTGWSAEQYKEAHLSQKGLCAMCGGQNPNRNLAADHSHRTGRRRGLLCNACNFLVSEVERLGRGRVRRAMKYLDLYDEEDT